MKKNIEAVYIAILAHNAEFNITGGIVYAKYREDGANYRVNEMYQKLLVGIISE